MSHPIKIGLLFAANLLLLSSVASAQYGIPLDGVPGGFTPGGLFPLNPFPNNMPQQQQPAFQQTYTPPQSTRPTGPSLLSLVQLPSVRKDLKLTEAQQGKIADLSRSQNRRGRPGFGPAQTNAFMPESSENNTPQGAASDAAVEKILDAKQRPRLRQIRLQAEGPMLFAREDLIARLNLDEGQIEMVQQIIGSNPGASKGVARGATSDRPRGKGLQAKETVAPVQAGATTGTTQQIYQLLRPRQRDVLKKILGEPVDLNPDQASDNGTTGETKTVGSQTKEPADPDKPASAANASPSNSTKASRKGLRERRGQTPGSNP